MGTPPGNRAMKRPRPQPLEDLTFRPSAGITLGVEVEFQVLDGESRDLAPGSVRILQACADEGIKDVTAELMQSMIEVKTGICRDVGEVRDTLWPVLRRVRHIAHSLGYDLALGGTHPLSRAGSAALFPDSRYQQVQERMGGLTYQFTIFGLHVHVGMPGGDEAIGVINALVACLPHLLALSANSPFWHGIDTGMASARAALFGISPRAGLPLHFRRWDEFCEYCQVMHACRAIAATKDLYWDIRPRPRHGTVEFRICDMPLTLGEVLGLVALIHCLSAEALHTLRKRPQAQEGDRRAFWIAGENKWRAARHGLRAECALRPGALIRPLASDLTAVLERLGRIARDLDAAAFLGVFQPLDAFVTGAERQRELYRATDNWNAVIDHMRQSWVPELEPRR
jgi:carboxylate-amine ligase